MPREPWTVAAPSGKVAAVLVLPDEVFADNGLTLRVRHGHRDVLTVTGLGLLAQPGRAGALPSVTGRDDRVIDESYQTTTGKRLEHRHRANETTFHLAVGQQRVELDVRVADDGVAYRHRLLGAGLAEISDEPATFTAAEGATVWLAPYRDNYENVWRGGVNVEALPGQGVYGFPVLFGLPGDTWCLLTEAAVDETYAASRLISLDAGARSFRLTLPEPSVRSALPWATPWRAAIVGPLSTIVESDLVTDLNPPSRLDDTTWIQPGRVAWSWWAQKLSPADLERQRAHVDYAAERGWEYVLVDARWDPAWLPGLVDYARRLGVRIIVWAHWTELATREQRDTLLPLWKSWDVAGIKVDFMESDIQERMAFYEELAAETASLRLMINYHGSTVPKGRQRTWPHIMTYEAVCGAEHYVRPAGPAGAYVAPRRHGPDPEHNTILPFTRNVIGAMDYTPVTFSHHRRLTSIGHELALAVVFESGWQHFADDIDTYAKQPIAERLLSIVPAAWDDTRLVAGRPGQLAIVARRRGPRWLVGGIGAGLPQQVRFRCDFLPTEVVHAAKIIEDTPNGHLRQRLTRITGDDDIVLDLTSDGGFVAEVTASPPREARTVTWRLGSQQAQM